MREARTALNTYVPQEQGVGFEPSPNGS